MLRIFSFSIVFLVGVVLMPNGEAVAQAKLDAEIFIDADPDKGKSQKNLEGSDIYFGPYGNTEFGTLDQKSNEKSAVYERTVARWKDPSTLPHTRAVCVKWARGDLPFGGGWKTCVGHKYQSRWMFVTARLRVELANQAAVENAVSDCLKTAAVASAAATILSGGSAALTAFEVVMKGCLASKLTSNLVSVSARTSSEWGDWE